MLGTSDISKVCRTSFQRWIDSVKLCFDFLNQAEIDFFLKDDIYGLLETEKRVPILLSRLQAMNLKEHLLPILTEFITAKAS